MTIFLYTVVVNSGCAPCVQDGQCTLNICKPQIRLAANVGDMVIGIMSQAANPRRAVRPHFERPVEAFADIGHLPEDLADGNFRIIYAMLVTEIITMQEYDSRFGDRRRDSIYDFANRTIRSGPHGSGQQRTDLSGLNTLISDQYVYYGRHAPQLDEEILAFLPRQKLPRNPARILEDNAFATRFRQWFARRVSPQTMWDHQDDHFVILRENALVEPHDMLEEHVN